MRHHLPTVAVLLGAAALTLGCFGTFNGAQGVLRFQASDCRNDVCWTPQAAVATGAVWTVEAVDVDVATASVDSSAVLDVRPVGDAAVELTATGVGVERLTWSGDASDWFEVEVATADAVRLVDPAQIGLEVMERTGDVDVTVLAGQLGPRRVHDVAMLEGTGLALWLEAADVDGRPLFVHHAGFEVTPIFGNVERDQHIVRLHGEAAEATVTALGVSDSITVTPVAAADVVALDVAVIDLRSAEIGDMLAVVAMARDAAGRHVWQVPVTWDLDPRLRRSELLDAFTTDATYARPDLALLEWHGEEQGVVEIHVGATFAGLSADAVVDWDAPDRFEGPSPDTGDPPVEPSCAMVPVGAGWLAIAFAALLVRRRRR